MNYKKWVFRIFIHVVILNILVFFITIKFNTFLYDPVRVNLVISILDIFATLSLLAGWIMIILSAVHKQLNDVKTWIGTIGLLFFTLFPFVIFLIS